MLNLHARKKDECIQLSPTRVKCLRRPQSKMPCNQGQLGGMSWLICDLGLWHKILWQRVRRRARMEEKGLAWVSSRVCEKAVGAEEVLTTSQVGPSQVTTSGSKRTESRMMGAREVMEHIYPYRLITKKMKERKMLVQYAVHAEPSLTSAFMPLNFLLVAWR